MARNATTDLNRELGTDLQLEDLNPKALLRKHLLSEEDEATLRKPLEDLYREVESDVKGLHADIKDTTTAALSTESATPAPAVPATPARKMIDTDAT
jgi:sec-independent protein translocase protein TatB